MTLVDGNCLKCGSAFRYEHKLGRRRKSCERCIQERKDSTWKEGCNAAAIQCAVCGKTFDGTGSRGAKRRYCSDQCLNRRRGLRNLTTYTIRCLQCGHSFTSTSKNTKTCPGACSVRYRFAKDGNLHTGTIGQCPVCARDFTLRYASQSKCSVSCVREARRRRIEQTRVRHTCLQCGALFNHQNSPRTSNKFCCKSCFFVWRKANPNGKRVNATTPASPKMAKQHYDRAKKFGRIYERFDANAIYERDGWRCGICGDEVDKLAVCPNPLAPSLDHIIPLSKGGDHVPNNVQCSHFGCNIRKGSKAQTISNAINGMGGAVSILTEVA